MKKAFQFLTLIFLVRFIATSCIPCNCDPVKGYERAYTSVSVSPKDNSGFQSQEIQDSVYINSFGLSISVNSDLTEITSNNINLNFLQFSTANACSCNDDNYTTIDPIDQIEIMVLDTETQEKTTVTDNFSTYDYDDKLITATELFEDLSEWQDGFQLDLSDFKNIPKSSVFTIKIILASGTELVQETEEIKFIK